LSEAAALISLLHALVFLTAKMNSSPIKTKIDTMKPVIRATKVTRRLLKKVLENYCFHLSAWQGIGQH